MTKTHRWIAALLALVLMAGGCGTREDRSENTEATSTVGTTETETGTADTETTVTETTTAPQVTQPEPIKEEKSLPEPYIDIEFYANGTAKDAMGHVDCTMPNSTLGRVENTAVSFGGKSYTVPHLYVEQAKGAMTLTYTYLAPESDVDQLLGGGFTIEAFLVNHNRLSAGATEQCMTNAGEQGGFGLSVKNGKYTFGTYTGSSWKVAAYDGTYDNENLTHLLGVYDPTAKTVKLYVNGKLVKTGEAAGDFRPAQNGCYPYIVLGGDIGPSGTQLHATNTRIADFKLYPASMTAQQAAVAYETAVARLTGVATDYKVAYVPVDGLPKGSEGALFTNVINSYAQVYEPKSAIRVTPTVLQWATDDLAALATKEERPATVIFDLTLKDGVLHALDRNGKDLGELSEAIKALNGRIIPAFRVNDPLIAEKLTDFLNRNRVGDGFFLSEDAELLYELWSASNPVRPILDRTALTEIDVGALYTEAAACGAKTVLLRAEALTQENTVAMQAHTLTVFAVADGADISDIHDLIFCGAEGIVTEDGAAVLDYYESFTETTVSNPTLIIAHRGDHENCPDNIMRSFIAAAESGADIIECDIWMTADEHLVLNHDATTTGWSENLDCKTSTRAQLEALTCTGKLGQEGDKLTFFDEMMAYFADRYPDMVFYVELKDQRMEVADKVIAIAKQYDVLDRIVLLSMNATFDLNIFNTYRVGLMDNNSAIYPRDDLQRALALSCIDLAALPTIYSSQWKDANEELMRLLRHRGIPYSPWTSNTAADTDRHYSLGYASITSNTPHQSDKYVRFLKVNETSDGQVTVTCVYYDGSTEDVTARAEFVPLTGNVTYSGGKVSGNGAYAFRLRTNLPILTDYVYYIYAQSVFR